MVRIKIKDKLIGSGHPCFFIAEIGSNHNKNLSLAKKLIDAAKKAGADCVKFQSFKADELVVKSHPAYDMLKKLELPLEWHYILADYCRKKDILFASTPFYLQAVDLLENIGVPFYKIASSDLTFYPLVEKIATTGKPIFLSTGMSYLSEIKRTVDLIKKSQNKKIVLLHCVTLYPPKTKDANLNSLITLEEKFNLPVGLSDHTRSLPVIIGAVAMGACVIERHFTLSRKLKGPDHPFAMEPRDFQEMVNCVRELEEARGRFMKVPVGEEIERRQYVRRKKISVNGKIKYLRAHKGYAGQD